RGAARSRRRPARTPLPPSAGKARPGSRSPPSSFHRELSAHGRAPTAIARRASFVAGAPASTSAPHVPEDLARNHLPQHLVRAFEDLVALRVAEQPLHGIVAHVAVPPVDLD